MWWVERPLANFEPNVDKRPCNVHVCSFQCAAGACNFSYPWPVTLVYISLCGRRVSLLATVTSDTRVHFIVRQARKNSCNHSQRRSYTFQCAAGACHFLQPWPVTLVYISACGRRVPFLAPMASDIRRVHFSVRHARATSSNRLFAHVFACVAAERGRLEPNWF